MVNSIKHNSVEAPGPSFEKVCPKCGEWAATQQVLYYNIFVQDIFGQRMFLNSPAQPSDRTKRNWSFLRISYGVPLWHRRACYTVQDNDGCLPNTAIFASWSPSLLIKLLPATLETQTRCLRTVTIPTLGPLPASAQIRSIPSSTTSHKFEKEKSMVYLFSDTLSSQGDNGTELHACELIKTTRPVVLAYL